MTRIKSIISLILILITTVFSVSFSQEWSVFLARKQINCLADEGQYLWVGTAGGGLVKLNKSTGEYIIYDEWNSKLPSNFVLAIAIDEQGNKWIGTLKGLAKFDGKNWTVYTTSSSKLPDNYIWAITIDGQGNKWIGTYGGGLAKFDDVNWTVFNTSNSGLPNNYVRGIAIDGQGNKWIGTEGGGLAKFDDVNWTVYKTSNSRLPSNSVFAIAIDEQGNKWIGTFAGLAKFDGVKWTVYDTSNSYLPSNWVRAIALDGQGNKWIGTRGGLAKFDGVNWTVYKTSNSKLPDTVVFAIAIDEQRNKWIGTSGGLALFREGGIIISEKEKPITKPKEPERTEEKDRRGAFIKDKEITCLAQAGDYLWIGTFAGGLVKLNKSTGDIVIYNMLNSKIPDNWVTAITLDKQKNIWIGTLGGGLAKFDGVNWTVYNTSNSGLPDNNVRAIAIDGQGNKWIGTSSGLAKFDGVNWSVYNTSNSKLPSKYIRAIAIDEQGNKWIGTWGGGLAKFDGVDWTVYKTLNSGLPNNDVWAIAIDEQGNKWIGTSGGLAKFDGVNWTIYNTSNSGLPDNTVTAIAIDIGGVKWIGTSGRFGGGLSKFDGVNWTVYNTLNSGLPNNDVTAIAIDKQGNKWIGTKKGLALFREGGIIISEKEKPTQSQKRPEKTEEKDTKKTIPPVITIISPRDGSYFTNTELTVQYAIKNPSGEPITKIRVLIDGKLLPQERGIMLKQIDEETGEITITAPQRDFELSLIAETNYSISAPSTVKLYWRGDAFVIKPKLYILAIGVSKYKDKDLQLRFASKDATDFVEIMKLQKGLLFEDVIVKLLVDEQATKDNILDGLDWLERQTTSKDVAILFLAGHGLNDRANNFYFLPVDVDIEHLKRTGVAFSDIKNTVSAISGKSIVFVDACHSGNVFGGKRAVVDMTSIVNELTSAESGVVVFASSTGKQFSFEDPAWGNGAFTKALIEGLKGKADLLGKGKITINMLQAYISERVKELTKGKQTPTVVKPQSVPDFPIAIIIQK
jgi:ligand-binding sensor domain-containing protein